MSRRVIAARWPGAKGGAHIRNGNPSPEAGSVLFLIAHERDSAFGLRSRDFDDTNPFRKVLQAVRCVALFVPAFVRRGGVRFGLGVRARGCCFVAAFFSRLRSACTLRRGRR